MNKYELKQELRKEKYEELSKKAGVKSTVNYEASNEITKFIPMGQPILVGHHSEKRHRKDLGRVNSLMRKSVEEMDKAEYYANKAESVGKGGISSDDPDAVKKLKVELKGLEDSRDYSKKLNAEYRKNKSIDDMSISDGLKVKLEVQKKNWFMGSEKWVPCESYVFSNLGANIRRIRKRIEILTVEANREEAKPIEREGFTIIESKEENRIMFDFDKKPPYEMRTLLKKNGWRWTPSLGTWTRKTTNAARSSASYLMGEIEKENLLNNV